MACNECLGNSFSSVDSVRLVYDFLDLSVQTQMQISFDLKLVEPEEWRGLSANMPSFYEILFTRVRDQKKLHMLRMRIDEELPII